MKKGITLMIAMILMAGTSGFAAGFGFINNPDRYPSVGLSLGMTDIDGPNLRVFASNSPAPTTDAVNVTQKTQDLTIDLRLPVSHELTLHGAFSIVSQELTSNDGVAVFSNNGDLDGFGFRIGARYYFNR